MSTNKTTEDGEPWVYHGFPESNTTPIPDEFFDIIAPKLTEAELRVALYVMRRTRGFKKSEDAISFSQLVGGIKTRDGRILDRGTGMSKSAVWRGVNGLVTKGILLKHTALSPLGDNETNVYRIHYRGDGGVVLQKNYPGSPKEPPVVLQENTQETVEQETEISKAHARDGTISSMRGTSKFRKGSRPEFDEGRTDEQPSTALASLTAERGMAHISEVLTTRGIPPPVRTTGRSQPKLSQRTPAPTPLDQPIPQGGQRHRRDTAVRRSEVALTGQVHADAAVSPKPTSTTAASSSVSDDEREALARYLGDFAPELGDIAKFTSTLTWTCNTYARSGLTLSAFIQRLYTARSRTKEAKSASHIRGRPFPFFKALVEEECGLRQPPPAFTAAAKARATEQASMSSGQPQTNHQSLAGRYADKVRR